MADYTFTLDLKVYDPVDLYQRAFTHAITVDKMTPEDAREQLLIAGSPDVEACISMILDPGSLSGCSIYGSSTSVMHDLTFADTEGDGL